MCLKNWIPSPTPSLAPSINPGISAITKLSPYSGFTTPKFGSRVVKWYSAILGVAAVTTDNIVDFPTLGNWLIQHQLIVLIQVLTLFLLRLLHLEKI